MNPHHTLVCSRCDVMVRVASTPGGKPAPAPSALVSRPDLPSISATNTEFRFSSFRVSASASLPRVGKRTPPGSLRAWGASGAPPYLAIKSRVIIELHASSAAARDADGVDLMLLLLLLLATASEVSVGAEGVELYHCTITSIITNTTKLEF